MDIHLTEAELRQRRSAKWHDYPADIIPAWIAEMDFALAPAVREALRALADRHDGGYPRRGGGQPNVALARAFAERMAWQSGWAIDPAQVQTLNDLTQGVYACLQAFTEPGQGVIVHTPCYPALRAPVLDMGRRFVAHPLRDDGTRFVLDDELMAQAPDAGTRLLLLCHPHNPTGRAFTRPELQALADYALRHDLLIVSDEVHADLILNGQPHIPMASLGPEIAARTITLSSASKGFNIAGLRCGVMHFGDAALAQRFWRAVPPRLLGQPGIAGVDATLAAWAHGQAWQDAVRAELRGGRDWLMQRFGALPGVRVHAPDATYFAWLDFSALNLGEDAAGLLLKRGRVALSPGQSFAPECAAFARLNFATSPALREQIFQRIAAALT